MQLDYCIVQADCYLQNKKAVSDNLFFMVSLNCPQIMSKYVK